MAKGPFKLKKLHPPYGTEGSPMYEFGYDEEVQVVDGLCEVQSEPLRDRLLKLGYAPAKEGEAAPAAPSKARVTKKSEPKKPEPKKSEKPKSEKDSGKDGKRREA